MNQFRVGLRRLTSHWKPLLLFELLWKVLTVLVIAPACAGLIQLAIRGAKLNYLTTSNLVKFLRSPWTILLIAVILLLAALYTLFEISAVCTCFRQPRQQGVRVTLGHMVRSGLHSLVHFFRGGGPLLVLHLLVLIPLMQFSATSGIFTAMGIPDFFAYYMTKKEFLLPIYVAVIVLCCLLSIRWIFSSVLFTQNQCSYRSARAASAELVRGRFWKTFFSVLLWNCCYFAVLLAFLCLIMLGVLMVIHGTGNSNVITSQAMRILKLLIQLVLWSFSFFATPICMAHLTALLEKRCAQLPEVALPEPIPLSRSAKPIRRSTALVTAGCFTVAALGLNLSYVYSVFTGKANFQLALFQNPTVMAHRGLSADAPENTLYAFSDAISVGADFIELDVQQTKDGVLVVMHDSNLKRTTGVCQRTYPDPGRDTAICGQTGKAEHRDQAHKARFGYPGAGCGESYHGISLHGCLLCDIVFLWFVEKGERGESGYSHRISDERGIRAVLLPAICGRIQSEQGVRHQPGGQCSPSAGQADIRLDGEQRVGGAQSVQSPRGQYHHGRSGHGAECGFTGQHQ